MRRMANAAGPTYYDVLGVSPDADGVEIKDAFRAKARRLHPDVSREPDAADRFAELSRAYSVLSRPTARLLYDRVGYRGSGNGGFDGGEPNPEGLARLFDVAEVEIDALDAQHGATRRVTVPTVGTCAACVGSGAVPGSRIDECADCDGSGRVRRTSATGSGRWLALDDCGTCAGIGRIVREPCADCDGTGKRTAQRTLKLSIPPGTSDGKLVRAQDENEDVYVALRVVPHREARLVRYAAAAALVLALFLFVTLAFFPQAL